jgi:hypothetical protein
VLKRQTLEEPRTLPPKAKPKTQPQSVKRTGEMQIARQAPMAKAKTEAAPKDKRPAEEAVENLQARTEEQAVADTAAPSSSLGTQELRSTVLTALKEVAYENIKTLVQETYKKNGVEISAQEVADISSLSCEMAAVISQRYIHQSDSPHWPNRSN